MAKANTMKTGEVSLPSFRGGEMFTVKPLTFGGMKAVGRAGEGDASQMDVMDIMLNETLKRSFPDVTVDEIDNIEQPDITKLSEAIHAANGGEDADFSHPTPASTTK